MNIKQAVNLIYKEQDIYISYDIKGSESPIKFNRDNALMMELYGGFKVGMISGREEGIELHIAFTEAKPIKEE